FDAVRFQLSEVIGSASELLNLPFPQVNLLPPQIASELAFSKKKPFFIAAAALFAIAPWPLFFGLLDANAALEASGKKLKAETATLQERQETIESLEKKNVPAAAFVEMLDGVLASRGEWNAFLADVQSCIDALQAPRVSEDGEKTFSSHRHIWVESLDVSRAASVPAAAEEYAGDEGAAEPVVRTTVNLKLRLLIPEVDGAKPEHNAAAFNARRRAVLDAFRKSEFVEKLTDQTDFSKPNFPTLTLRLVLKPGKGI
ncbi:MAG TPA: hypothetical protein IAC75_00205, partial [Candidatus Spyradosoma merdigallinarum]|nr:hypothetical protein [Candidatus Spyradosoma merdigallinarum]